MKLKYVLGFILLPLLIIIPFNIYSYNSFMVEINDVQENVVIPTLEYRNICSEIQFLSDQLYSSVLKSTSQLHMSSFTKNKIDLKEEIQHSIILRGARQLELQKLKELKIDYPILREEFSDQLDLDLEDLVIKSDKINTEITSELATFYGVEESFFRISDKIENEYDPTEKELNIKLTIISENNLQKVIETRKTYLETKESGLQRLYFVSGISIIGFIFIVTFLNFIMIKPINKLTSTFNEISRGKFDIEIDPEILKSNDEIADLAISFTG